MLLRVVSPDCVFIFDRIRSLRWVTLQQLEANVKDTDIGVRSALDAAIAGNLCCFILSLSILVVYIGSVRSR